MRVNPTLRLEKLSEMSDKPFFLAYFGKPHSGKSYDLQQFVKKCGKSSILVYNRGWEKDWTDFIEIEIWADKKEEVLMFTYNGKEYEFAKHYMKLFRGKKVKAAMVKTALAQRLIYEQMSSRGYEGLFFIIDDATGVMGATLTQAQKACFFGAKHVGIWFALVFHDPNKFPVGAWNALTLARFFKNNVPPPKNKEDKIPHFPQMKKSFQLLKDAPEYSCCTLDMGTGDLTFIPYKNTKTK